MNTMLKIKASNLKGDTEYPVKDIKLVWLGKYNSEVAFDEALERIYNSIDRSCRLHTWMWDLKFYWIPIGIYPINTEFDITLKLS